MPGGTKLADIVADSLIFDSFDTGLGIGAPGIIYNRLYHSLILGLILNISDEAHIYF